ncbi:hypothetical protein BC826DRAFT_1032924 [Russula brevipes]|nr:hypothetical protein BC826DRAFT_1032924 [Russula brevipes]
MLVGNPPHQSPFTLNATDLSDFVNLDLFTTQSSTTSDSRDPSPSVSSPLFSPLPVISEPNPSDWFNFSLDEDITKTDQSAPPQVTSVPWDFLTLSKDSPDSESTSPGGGLSPSFAIDPQLMSSSMSPEAPHDLGEVEDLAEREREEEDEEEETITLSPIKVGGKGKSRKGTVQSGGIQKKPTVSAVVRDKDDPRDDGDDWRPSPEEYKKMSSKEKRQLRNKISARNFRVRRKEYITTLEGDIAERDRLIDHIRTELGSSQSENAALRQEISALKKALVAGAGRADSPALPPPGPIPATAPSRASSSLVTPNTQKDLPSSPHLAASASRAFWGGSAAFGGITPVHTTLIPENFAQPLASVKSFDGLSKATFDCDAGANPFTMKMLDANRMRLWARIYQCQPMQSQQQPPVARLAPGLRPHHFASPPSSSSTSSLLSGKRASTYLSPPSSPKLGPATPPFIGSNEPPTPQEALLAMMASQTLLQRLGSAFWNAFAAHSPSNEATPSAGIPTLDADKIRRVLEGKAVVSIVDIEPEANTREGLTGCGRTAVLEEGMRALRLSKE